MYQKPEIRDLGTIAENTFNNPGKGDKGGRVGVKVDKFGENGHAPGSN